MTALAVALLALALAGAAPPAPDPAAPAPLPHPDLSALEDAVAARLREGRALLEALLAAPGTPAAELADAYGELGRLYHAHDFAEAAAAAYRNAGTLAPKDYRWPYAFGRLAQAAGGHAEAAGAYRRALELRPGDAPALVHLGEVLLAQDLPDEAERQFSAALAADTGGAAARAGLGQVALSRRRYGEAVEHLEAALAAAPQADALYHPLALAYRGLGDTEKARRHLARAGAVGVAPADPLADELRQAGTGERWHLLRGRVAYRVGRFADAAAEFRAAVAARPESAGARVALGAALAAAGDAAGAAEQLAEALRLDPRNGTAHYNLGTLREREGKEAEALEHLRAAVAADAGDGAAHHALGRLLDRAGRPEEALAHFTDAVELLQADEQAALDEAGLLVRLGRYRPARARLEEAWRRLPASGRVAHALARLLAGAPDVALRDGARALELAQKVHAARPEAGAAATVALALAELGRCGEAAEWQRRALAAARAEGPAERLAELERTLAGYARGAPCRPPAAP